MKTNNRKLLAAVAILAMVVCAFAAILPAEQTDATASIGGSPYSSFSDAVAAIPADGSNTVITLTGNETVSGTVDLKGATVLTNGYTLTINEGNTTLSNGKITGDGKYVDLIIGGASAKPTGVDINNIVFSTPGYFSIDIRNATVTISDCDFEGAASSAIYIEAEDSIVDVEDCEFNGTYSEGSISFDMGDSGTVQKKVTINSNTPTQVSVGIARGNMTIGGNSANIVLGTGVTISDVYLDVNGNYTGTAASKLTVAMGAVSVNSVIGNGSVDVSRGASFKAVQSDVPITGDGEKEVENSTITTITPKAIADAFESSSEVTIEGVKMTESNPFIGEIVVPVNQTLNIIDSTIYGGTFDVKGTLSLDNAYVYAGAKVDEKTGEVVAINTHNPTTTQSLTQNTSVGIGDSLTLTGAVPSGVTLSVYGTLITNDLTVEGAVDAYIGSTVTINGTVVVAEDFTLKAGAELELNGTITIRDDRNGGAALTVSEGAKMTVTSEGTINVNKPTANGAPANILDIDGTFVLEGTMTVTGTLLGQVENKGTITFNGTAGTTVDDTIIVMYDGVSMTVTSVTGYLAVTDGMDDKIVLDYLGKESLLTSGNSIEKTSTGNAVMLYNVRGVTISESITSDTDKIGDITYRSYMSNMTVSGTAAIVNGQTEGAVAVYGACTNALTGVTGLTDEVRVGTMTVGDVTVGSGITFGFVGNSTVSGAFTAIAQATSGKNALEAATVMNGGNVTVTGTMTLTTSNASNLEDGIVNAVRYYVTDATDGEMTAYYTGFANALAAVSGADNDEIVVLGDVTAEGTTELAAGMTILVEGTLTIDVDAQLTIAATATAINNGGIIVDGVLIITDNNTGLTGKDPVYDVKKTVGSTDTYSSLTYALANAQAGETITLSQKVTLKTNTTIPEGVILETGRNTVTFEKDVTLTVNGTFAVQNGGKIDKTATGSKIVVNGVMSNASNDVDLTKLGIAGAYFSIRNVNYVSNVAYAAANIGNGTDITIRGTITSGDVTFTAGTSGLTVTVVDDAVYSAGIVTLDGSTLEIAVGGTMSGTVTAAAGDSTASVEFSKLEAVGSGFTVESDVKTTVDGDVDYLAINGNVNSGNVTIASGNVTASRIVVNSASAGISTQKGLLAVAEGATLSVPEQAELYIRANEDVTKTAFSVAGTLDIDNTVTITGLADIAGTVNINDGASMIITTYKEKVGTVNVDGTIAVSDNENDRGNLIVGTEKDGAGILAVNGTVTGQVSIDSNAAYIKAYETADLSGADIEWNYTTEESSAETTAFYINGQLYMTVYGTSASSVTIDTIVSNETYDHQQGRHSRQRGSLCRGRGFRHHRNHLRGYRTHHVHRRSNHLQLDGDHRWKVRLLPLRRNPHCLHRRQRRIQRRRRDHHLQRTDSRQRWNHHHRGRSHWLHSRRQRCSARPVRLWRIHLRRRRRNGSHRLPAHHPRRAHRDHGHHGRHEAHEVVSVNEREQGFERQM